jgi:uncharacterized protein YjbI with pentapeptide repeats
MADTKQLEILNRGIEEWNRWRKQNPELRPDLSNSNLINRDLSRADFDGADLSGADLSKAQLSHASLHGANLESSTLILADLLGAILNQCDLSAASLFGAFLFGTRLKGANLSAANLMGTSLMGADLSAANLTGAHLMGANFHDANLSNANLSKTNLTAASLVGARIENTTFENCSVYGVSAFNLQGNPKLQSNLVITPLGEPPIAVDDLEAAQFLYLLLSSRKIPQMLDSIQSRFVLIIGDFRSKQESVLGTIQECLQQEGYTSVVASLVPPVGRDLRERILRLSRFVRFVVADLTDSKPTLQLLRESSSDLPHTLVQPLLQGSRPQTESLELGGESILESVIYLTPDDLKKQFQRKLTEDLS